MEATDRLSTVIVPFEVLDIIIKELHVAEVDGVFNFPVGENEIDGFGLKEVEGFSVLDPANISHLFLGFFHVFIKILC